MMEPERLSVNPRHGRSVPESRRSMRRRGQAAQLTYRGWAHGYAPGDARPGRRARRAGRRRRRPGRQPGEAPHPPGADGTAGRPAGRPPHPRREGGHPGPRSAETVPAIPAGPHARPHLLGLPRPAHDDRRGGWPGHRSVVRDPRDRRQPLAGTRAGRVRGRRARRDRDRALVPARRAPGAFHREPSGRGLPDPRPDLLDRRHALPRPRGADRASAWLPTGGGHPCRPLPRRGSIGCRRGGCGCGCGCSCGSTS